MPIAENAWHVMSAALVFMLGVFAAVLLARRFDVPWRRSLFLYAWHTGFCLLYLYYSLNNVADSTLYYTNSLGYAGGMRFGTGFVVQFTSIFSRYLGLSYLGAFLVYNVVGFFGLLALYGALRQAMADKSLRMRYLGFAIVLLPSISFWSVAIGKDAIAFMAAGFLLWAALDLRRRGVMAAFSVFLMFLVRPHMAALMVAAWAIGSIFSANVSMLRRIVLGSMGILAALVVIPLALQYVGLDDAQGAADISEYVEARQDSNLGGGSSVNISTMSAPLQLATYMFRPLPFEAHNLTSLIASFDNLILLALGVMGVFSLWRARKWSLPGSRMMLWLYAVSAWVLLAVTTANLGIAMRQKWMVVPILLYLVLSAIGKPVRLPRGASPS